MTFAGRDKAGLARECIFSAHDIVSPPCHGNCRGGQKPIVRPPVYSRETSVRRLRTHPLCNRHSARVSTAQLIELTPNPHKTRRRSPTSSATYRYSGTTLSRGTVSVSLRTGQESRVACRTSAWGRTTQACVARIQFELPLGRAVASRHVLVPPSSEQQLTKEAVR